MKEKYKRKTDKEKIIELEYRVNLLAIVLKDNSLITDEQYKKLLEIYCPVKNSELEEREWTY